MLKSDKQRKDVIYELREKINDLELKKRIRIYLPSEYANFDSEILRLHNLINVLETHFKN